MNTKSVLSKLFLVFLGLTAVLLSPKGTGTLQFGSAQAARPADVEALNFRKVIRPEIEAIVVEEIGRYATNEGLTSEGKALVAGVAKEIAIKMLTQETWRQLRKIEKSKPVKINYNKSKTPTPVAISADGHTIVATGSEGILVSRDAGSTWYKVVAD